MHCCIRYFAALLLLFAVPIAAENSRLHVPDAESQFVQIELAIAAGRLTQAEAMLQSLEQQLPDESRGRHMLLFAELNMAKGDSDATARALTKVPADIADQCRYGAIAGWLAYQEHQWNQTITMLAKSLEICPGDPGRWNLLGLALVQKNEMAAALEAYDQALTVAPNNPSLLNNRALAYAYSGNTAAALTDLEKAASFSNETAIMANLSTLRANAGLEMPFKPSQDAQTLSIIFASAGEGANAAERHEAARSYFAQAILQSERFDNDLWTKANSTAVRSITKSEDRTANP
jgi:Flp pilus assembly protein TadD